MINHRLLFLFQWKYMRENLFNGTSVNRQTLRIEVENVLHLLLYISKVSQVKIHKRDLT